MHNPDSTVPMYAGESGLLVFGALLTSVSLYDRHRLITDIGCPINYLLQGNVTVFFY